MYIQYFADQYEILAKFPKEVRWNTLDAIMQYAFMGIEPKLDDDPIAYALFEWSRFSVDKSVKLAKAAIENWKKWWAPKWNQNAVKSFQNMLKQPEDNQRTTQNNQEQRTTNNEQRTMNKEQKKEINNTQTAVWARKIYSEEFEKFWNVYPKKKGKVKAYEAWNKRIASWIDSDYITQKASDYAREIRLKKVEDQFIKRPQWWLNEWRYDDEYFTWRKKQEVKIEETKELTEEERNEIRLNLQNFRESLCKKTAIV